MASPPPPRGGPTPQQLQAMQAQLAAEAAKRGLSVEAYVNQLKAQAMRAAQQQQLQKQQQGSASSPAGQVEPHIHTHDHDHDHAHHHHHQPQQVPINPGAPNPQAIALAGWLRSQDLKSRTCILNGQRKDMFKGASFSLRSQRFILILPPSVKRALRALESPAYTTAQKKNPVLPSVTDRPSAENAFKLLPLSLLALRVSKSDPHEGHGHGTSKPAKRIKGLWTVKIEQQQEIGEQLHFVWLYEGPQWKTKLYAAGALVLILAVVLFPLWPASLRLGVWYLSMGMLGLIGLFFAMSIFRLILFGITIFAAPPGLWLYPNLFEDVGFFDSFRPVWGWQEEKKTKKKKAAKKEGAGQDTKAASSAVELPSASKGVVKPLGPRVEEVEDSD